LLEVSSDGFKPVKQNVTLQVAQVANVNVVLQPGTITEQIVVTEDAALVDSASSDIGTTVATRQIKDLPLNGRNFTQLATLIRASIRAFQATSPRGRNNAETFRLRTSNGASLARQRARPRANNFTLDGLDNNESLVNTIVFFPSAEAIQDSRFRPTSPRPSSAAPARDRQHDAEIRRARSTAARSSSSAMTTLTPAHVRAGHLEFRRNQFGGTVGAPSSRTNCSSSASTRLPPVHPVGWTSPHSHAVMRQGSFRTAQSLPVGTVAGVCDQGRIHRIAVSGQCHPE
jgi:hypothetical protein